MDKMHRPTYWSATAAWPETARPVGSDAAALQAVDGIALKAMVDAWAVALLPHKACPG